MGTGEAGQTPDATVIITTRDRPSLVRRAVESALHQTMGGLEVLVVDDGSHPPFTPQPEDRRLRVIRHPSPMGVCAARNSGLKGASGRWVTFLDDDDELLPHMLETSLAAIRTSSLPEPVVALSAIEVVDEMGTVEETRVPITLPAGSHYHLENVSGKSFQAHNTLVAESSLLLEIGGWDERLQGSEHDDLFLRINQVASIQGIREVTYRLRSGAPQRRSADLAARATAMELTVAKHPDVFAAHPRRHARYLRVMGMTYLRAGRWAAALRGTTRSLMIDPRSREGWIWWLASLAGPPGVGLYRVVKRRAGRGGSFWSGGRPRRS